MNIIFNSNLSNTIGSQSDGLLYKLKEDLQLFRKLTSGSEEKPSVLITGFNTLITLNIDNGSIADSLDNMEKQPSTPEK